MGLRQSGGARYFQLHNTGLAAQYGYTHGGVLRLLTARMSVKN
jgi:hypothetical protein